MMDAKQISKLAVMFKTEAADHIANINQRLLQLERANEGEDQTEYLEEIFRAAHSLKGAARTVGFTQIENIAHHMESVLGSARTGQLRLNSRVCDVLYSALDTVQLILNSSMDGNEFPVEAHELLARLAKLHNGVSPSALPTMIDETNKVAEALPMVASVDETIRVNINKLETLMAQASELLIFKITAEQRLADLKKMRSDFKRQRKNGHKNYGLPQEGLWVSDFYSRLSELEHRLANDTVRLGMVINNLQEGIRQTRMLPFSTLNGVFTRIVRDLSHQLGKEVVLQIEGSQIEVDKKILEEMRDPIMHLLGNAVDHAIEFPEERQKLGKPLQSRIKLSLRQMGNFISVIVEDDGRGLDLEALKSAALRAGVIQESDLNALTENEIIQFALLHGISTHEQVTSVSGRGVGLDVVRHKVESLHGQIDIETQTGHGTRFSLLIPLTLATTRGLLISVSGETYVLPITAVVKIIMARARDIQTINGRETLSVNGKPIALVRLADLLDLPTPPIDPDAVIKTVILKSNEVQIAFIVDELVGEQEMVMKSLGRQLVRVPNIAGATLLGTGDVVLILNSTELIRLVQGKTNSTASSVLLVEEEAIHNATILVVDDSITTRTLEKNILEAAGYHVVTAMDGTEAMRYLQSYACDLVVSDVQMPQMDGIELTKTIKNSHVHGSLPVILVTSLDSQSDRERGLSAGANAYIVKSGFDQSNLLSTIKQLL